VTKKVHINVCLILNKVRINEKIWNQMTTTIPDKFKNYVYFNFIILALIYFHLCLKQVF